MVNIQGHNACRVLGMCYVPNSFSNSIVIVVAVAVFSLISEKVSSKFTYHHNHEAH